MLVRRWDTVMCKQNEDYKIKSLQPHNRRGAIRRERERERERERDSDGDATFRAGALTPYEEKLQREHFEAVPPNSRERERENGA